MVGIGGQILQGEGELKDVSAVQRLGKAAAGPLVSLVTGSLGLLVSSTVSTTAMAVNGGLSVVRIGVGMPYLPNHMLRLCFSTSLQSCAGWWAEASTPGLHHCGIMWHLAGIGYLNQDLGAL